MIHEEVEGPQEICTFCQEASEWSPRAAAKPIDARSIQRCTMGLRVEASALKNCRSLSLAVSSWDGCRKQGNWNWRLICSLGLILLLAIGCFSYMQACHQKSDLIGCATMRNAFSYEINGGRCQMSNVFTETLSAGFAEVWRCWTYRSCLWCMWPHHCSGTFFCFCQTQVEGPRADLQDLVVAGKAHTQGPDWMISQRIHGFWKAQGRSR